MDKVGDKLKRTGETLRKRQDAIDATVLSYFAEDQPFSRTAEGLHEYLADATDGRAKLEEVRDSLERLVKAGKIRRLCAVYCNQTYYDLPENARSTAELDAWLERHGAMLAADARCKGIRYSQYLLPHGKTVIVRILTNPKKHRVLGWDVFIPAEESNSVDATIAALDRYVAAKAA